MDTNVIRKIIESKEPIIIFDIDGTLKDLCSEHDMALRLTLDSLNIRKVNKTIILKINSFATTMIKLGIFPTNNIMQKLLILAYSILSFNEVKGFSERYYQNYSNQIYLFSDQRELLKKLKAIKQIYFVTINKQNYNLEELNIQEDNFFYKNSVFKYNVYKKALLQKNISKKDILIVGDNFFDDFISAKLLGIKCLIVNNYNIKLKEILCKKINKNI